jgi:uncharacterized protein (TIGR03083 family)
MGDVVAHLGGVHRWAASIVAERTYDGRGHRRGEATGDGLLRWFDEGVELLVSTLKTADPDEECGNFSPGSPNTVQFWRRRQAHETSMHRWDVESAVERRSPIDAEFATDGIDELFHTFTRTRGKQVLAGPIRIVTTDSGAAWSLGPTSKPGRVDLVPDGADAVASLAGPAENLLLALWKRITLDEADVAIDGAEDAVRQFVAGPISP